MPFSQCDSLLEGIMKLVKCFMYVVFVLTNQWKVVTMLSCYKGAACSRSLYTVPSSKTLEIYVKV